MNNGHQQLGLPVCGVSKQQLRANAPWFLGLGIGLVLLGTLAVIFSYATTLFSVMYLGAFLIVVGSFEAVKSFKIHLWSTFFLHIFLSVLYIVGGVFILSYPTINALSLTLLLAVFFVVSGVLKIIFSCMFNTLHKGWLIANGLITFALGICIWTQWPMSGLWVLGMLIGVETMVTGWTFIMLAVTAKRID